MTNAMIDAYTLQVMKHVAGGWNTAQFKKVIECAKQNLPVTEAAAIISKLK